MLWASESNGEMLGLTFWLPTRPFWTPARLSFYDVRRWANSRARWARIACWAAWAWPSLPGSAWPASGHASGRPSYRQVRPGQAGGQLAFLVWPGWCTISHIMKRWPGQSMSRCQVAGSVAISDALAFSLLFNPLLGPWHLNIWPSYSICCTLCACLFRISDRWWISEFQIADEWILMQQRLVWSRNDAILCFEPSFSQNTSF